MRIAFCGVGRMGRLMAGHVQAAGHDVVVWNRTPGRAAELLAAGAAEAATPAEAADGADIAVLVLYGPDSVAEVLSGSAGVLSAARPPRYVVDTTTVSPADARRFAAVAAPLGVRYLDAPLFGSTDAAAAATVQTFVGSRDEEFAAIRPLLACWCSDAGIHHAGPVGAGAALKVVRNMAHGIATAGIGEALRLAGDLGLDREAAISAIGAGPFSWTMAQKSAAISSRDFTDVTFSLGLLAKDTGLAATAGERSMPLTTAAWEWAQRAADAGLGDLDYPSLATYVEDHD